MNDTIKNFFRFINDNHEKPIPNSLKIIHFQDLLKPHKKIYLPRGIKIDGKCDITSLPDNLIVESHFEIDDSYIKKFPENLTVKGYISIENTIIDSFPKHLKFTPIFGGKQSKKNIKHIYIAHSKIAELFSDDDLFRILGKNLIIHRHPV
jgi:hypothetical protein